MQIRFFVGCIDILRLDNFLLRKKPVIVANHGGGIEQVIPEKTGWLFRPGDPISLSETLKQVIDIENHNKSKLSNIAINHVKKFYSKANMCSATLDIYAELRK